MNKNYIIFQHFSNKTDKPEGEKIYTKEQTCQSIKGDDTPITDFIHTFCFNTFVTKKQTHHTFLHTHIQEQTDNTIFPPDNIKKHEHKHTQYKK